MRTRRGVFPVALEAEETELLLLAKKVQSLTRDRVLERPDAFCKLAARDEVIRQVDRRHKARC